MSPTHLQLKVTLFVLIFDIFHFLMLLGPTQKMNLVEAIRSAMEIVMEEDKTAGECHMIVTWLKYTFFKKLFLEKTLHLAEYFAAPLD